MFCDYDNIFWSNGVGCGDRNTLHYGPESDSKEISLSSTKGLAEWVDVRIEKFKTDKDFQQKPEYAQWYDQGKKLAEEIRKILPPELDLWYGGDGWENLTYIPLRSTPEPDFYESQWRPTRSSLYKTPRKENVSRRLKTSLCHWQSRVRF